MVKKQKKLTTKGTSTLKSRTIQCKKSHGHLVCWITTKSAPQKKRIFFNFIIPGTHNNHTPHLIRRSSLLAIAFLLLIVQVGYNHFVAHQDKILGYATNVSAKEVVDAVNSSRISHQQKRLNLNSELNKAASLKADNMLKIGYWAHNGPDGTQPWHWFEQAGYDYQNAGENLAKDFKTSTGVVNAWLDSQTHRTNMLGTQFEDIGVAVVNGTLNGKETTLVVALFGTTKASLAAQQDTGITTSTTVSHQSNLLASPAQIKALKNPASIITLSLLLVIALVALLTHFHYVRLPRNIRKAWYKHHALYTSFIALLIVSYVGYIFTSGSI